MFWIPIQPTKVTIAFTILGNESQFSTRVLVLFFQDVPVKEQHRMGGHKEDEDLFVTEDVHKAPWIVVVTVLIVIVFIIGFACMK